MLEFYNSCMSSSPYKDGETEEDKEREFNAQVQQRIDEDKKNRIGSNIVLFIYFILGIIFAFIIDYYFPR